MNKLLPCDLYKVISKPLGKKVEQDVIENWASSFWAAVDRREPTSKDTFAMMLPPPNITGNLHLGHALTAAIQDALARQRRMAGRNVSWIPGFDHAGLATQTIVENLIWTKEGVTRQQIGRDKFLQVANDWKELKRDQMRNQLNRLGLELTRDREFFTMDKKSSWAVHEAFKQLFQRNIIYRASRPVFWSHRLNSTLSDIEVEQVGGVNRYIRTGEEVEQRSLPQWFISAENMARRAVEVVENSSIEMIPQNYKNSWSSWLVDNGVQDWCISRQSWWGHRIPAYKLESSADVRENWVVADSLEEARTILSDGDQVLQDSDVLDTWFSSSLLPLTVSGWPNKKEFATSCSQGAYPLDIMETGFDILTYWVSKMVMVCLALGERIPFKLILLHGMICDSDGKKMSKSKGNVIDPLDVIDGASLESMCNRTRELSDQGIIDKHQLELALSNQRQLFPNGIPKCGADGLRAYLLSHDVQQEVVRVQIQQIDRIRRLSNKIWNVVRFLVIMLESNQDLKSAVKLDISVGEIPKDQLSEDDQQLLNNLADCVQEAYQAFNDTYELQRAFNRLEAFWVVDLSHGYMAKVKPYISGEKPTKEGNQKVQIIIKSLSTGLQILHPFMPHLSEFLFQKLHLTINPSPEGSDCIRKLQRLGELSFPTTEEWAPYMSHQENGEPLSGE